MKKIFSIIMACICCVAVLFTVACDSSSSSPSVPDGYKTVDTYNEKTTEQIYTDIMNTINEYNGNFTASTDYTIDVTMTMMDTQIPVEMEMGETIKVADGMFYEFTSLDMTCEQLPSINQTQYAEIWHIDNTAYINNPYNRGAQKVKVDVSWEGLCSKMGLDENAMLNPVYDFSDSSFDKVKFYIDENVEDDDVVAPYFELQIKGDKSAEYTKKNVEKLSNQIDDVSVKVSNIKYQFYMTEDASLDYVGIVYTMTIKGKIQGIAVTYKYEFNGALKFTDVGTTSVTGPLDPGSYVPGFLI